MFVDHKKGIYVYPHLVRSFFLSKDGYIKVQQFGPEIIKYQSTFIENELCDRNTIRVMNENTAFENMFENNPLSLGNFISPCELSFILLSNKHYNSWSCIRSLLLKTHKTNHLQIQGQATAQLKSEISNVLLSCIRESK